MQTFTVSRQSQQAPAPVHIADLYRVWTKPTGSSAGTHRRRLPCLDKARKLQHRYTSPTFTVSGQSPQAPASVHIADLYRVWTKPAGSSAGTHRRPLPGLDKARRLQHRYTSMTFTVSGRSPQAPATVIIAVSLPEEYSVTSGYHEEVDSISRHHLGFALSG